MNWKREILMSAIRLGRISRLPSANKKHFILLIVTSLFCLACNKYIQKEYFNTYTKIINDSLRKQVKISGVYVSPMYVKNSTENYTVYEFYFANNLTCFVILPLGLGNGKWIRTENELIDALKNNQINDRLSWSYFSLKNNLSLYDIDPYTEGAESFPFYVIPIYIRESKISNDTSYSLHKKYKIDRVFGIRIKNRVKISEPLSFSTFKPFPIKPDSTKSSFLELYSNYLKNGSTLFQRQKTKK